MPSRFTLEEVASELRTKVRWLREWLRAHPRDEEGEPFYTPVGRDKVFHQSDVARIEREMRKQLCRSNSGRRAKVKHRTTKSEAPTDVSMLKLAAELTGDPTLLKNLSASKTASTSTANTPRRHLHLVQGGPHS